MKVILLTLFSFLLLLAIPSFAQEMEFQFEKDTVKLSREQLPDKFKVDYRIDNMGYWKKMADMGLVPVAPNAIVPAPVKRTSKILAKGIAAGNSVDVTVTTSNSTQSENSIFVSPTNGAAAINSNNSTPQPSTGSIYGADEFNTSDSSSTWGGTFQGAGGGNSGDPTTAIDRSGRWYVGFINNTSGQSVAYSDNQGVNWTVKAVAAAPSGFNNMLDKNHMWIDNSESSPYEGNLYDAWTTFGGTNDSQIGISRSTDRGNSWSSAVHISSAVNAGSHNQGVNIKTGPDGQVYVVWAIYDAYPADEDALGMARSLDGGATYLPATRIITNIKGIRNHGVTQSMRVNSFPSMAVDLSNGPHRGNIYIVWTNVNTPGVNTGSGVEVYLIKSSDQGLSWSTPVKVNTDPLGTNKQHYLPWVTCDPSNGNVSIVFYDNRNVTSTQAEAWCAISIDAAETFTDFAVSDVAFTPSPIPNMASNYMGDYLGITANYGVVYPCWTDTRSGHCMTYVSPFLLSPAMNQAFITFESYQLNDYSFGNHNGTLDYGEDLLISLVLKNIGDKPDTNVMVTLSSDSPYITFSDSTEFYGNFAVGQIKTMPDGFAFHVSDSVPNGTELVFNVKAVNNLDSVNYSYFSISANAPELTIANIHVNDPLGNNNHFLDPGEDADIVIKYNNNSLFPATSPVSHLSTPQTFVSILNPAVTMPGIGAGQSDSATFHVKVSDIPFGTAAQFTNLVNYSYQSSQKSFVESIGLIVEDWETGTFTKFPWTFAGNADWTLDNTNVFEGQYSARSGAITHNQTSSLVLNYSVMYNDSISFYRKVSSELFHDVLSFYIDGVKIGQWSGNQNWKRMAYPVLAGPHVFKWEYAKDGSNSIGMDAGWVDFIVFPPELKTVVFAGNNMYACEGDPVQLHATAANFQTLSWSTSGTGTFNDNTILNPVYTPSSSDIASGTVTLTLTVNGKSYNETSSSSLILTINPKPTVFAGPDEAICKGTQFTVNSASATNYATLSWTTSGDGVFSDPTVMMPTYTPGSVENSAGKATLYLTVNTGNACPSRLDTLLLTIHPLPVTMISSAATLCKGDSTQLSYTISGQPPFVVTYDGGSTRIIPAANWQEWVKPAATATFSVISTTDAFGCIGTDVSNSTIQVLQSPVSAMSADTALCGNLTLNLSAKADGAVSYLWAPGGQTTQTISIDSVGLGLAPHTFSVTMTGSNGCKSIASSAVTFKDCTGIEDYIGKVGFSIYPNPSQGDLYISFNSLGKEELSLRIVNTKGAVVYGPSAVSIDGNMTKHLNLKNLSQGSYLLFLENSGMQVNRKLVITK
ncbi:MAG: T9SS type A sorting domain-containing protein [Bacteroidetes bacterium]|nr:T9SS type A sorting domain-containing protein [Bacteroidota bacterium]